MKYINFVVRRKQITKHSHWISYGLPIFHEITIVRVSVREQENEVRPSLRISPVFLTVK